MHDFVYKNGELYKSFYINVDYYDREYAYYSFEFSDQEPNRLSGQYCQVGRIPPVRRGEPE